MLGLLFLLPQQLCPHSLLPPLSTAPKHLWGGLSQGPDWVTGPGRAPALPALPMWCPLQLLSACWPVGCSS